MKITFGLVVYQEEAFIARCLDSIKEVADEIIVVHDGPCHDCTLEIAKRYTPLVFVGERLGGSDPHRIRILEQARNEWVFMIDADEILSSELQHFLMNLLPEQQPDVSAYAFLWPHWDGKKMVVGKNYKPVLFDRRRAWMVGLHNFSIQTTGHIRNEQIILEHRPKEKNFGWEVFQKKLNRRVVRDAKQFSLGFEALRKFHPELAPAAFEGWYRHFLAHPLRYAFWHGIKHFLGSYKNVYKDGWNGFVVSLQLGVYQCKLGVTLWNIKRTSQ